MAISHLLSVTCRIIACLITTQHIINALPLQTTFPESLADSKELRTNAYHVTEESNTTTDVGLIHDLTTEPITEIPNGADAKYTTEELNVNEAVSTDSSEVNTLEDVTVDVRESTSPITNTLDTTMAPKREMGLSTPRLIQMITPTRANDEATLEDGSAGLTEHTTPYIDVIIPSENLAEDKTEHNIVEDEPNVLHEQPTPTEIKPEVVQSNNTVHSNRVSRSLRMLLLPSPTGFVSNGPTALVPSVGSLLTPSSVTPLVNASVNGIIEWQRMNGAKDGADSVAWMTSSVFSGLFNLREDDINVQFLLNRYAQLSDHPKIPESLITELQTCQNFSVVYNSLRTVRDIFYSYGQYMNVFRGDTGLGDVRNRYCGLRKIIRKLTEPSSTGDCSIRPADGVHPDTTKIAETLATLNLLAVRTSTVLQEIINMHGNCPGV